MKNKTDTRIQGINLCSTPTDGDCPDRVTISSIHRIFTLVVTTLLVAALPAGARVSEEQAARLNGTDLTPFGGEVAGNEDGTIPAWTGKWFGLPPDLEYHSPTGKRPNPYAHEKPLFSITAANYAEHKGRLTEGQVALFEQYPTFRMDIYPSHRDFTYPQYVIDQVKWNAVHTEVDNGIETLKDWTGGTAFPIPGNAAEVMWNQRSNRYFATWNGTWDEYGVFSNGDISHTATENTMTNPFGNPENPVPTTETVIGDRNMYTLSVNLAPPREKGKITATQEPIDFKANKRNAWQYDPGTRRVRKAPAIGYDNPTGPGGLYTIDDHKGFNGAFDRYEFELLGKREIYVPYHTYDFNDPTKGDLDDRLTRFHPNPDYVRYELHRVWIVEASLAPGKRHAYKKRRWYIDEDSWHPMISENFDGRGNLWRVGMFFTDYHYDVGCYEKQTQVFMDIPSGAYVTTFVTLERDEWDYTVPFMGREHFTPAAIRRLSRR